MNKFVVNSFVSSKVTCLSFYAYYQKYGNDSHKYVKSVPLVTVELWRDDSLPFITSHFASGRNDVQYFINLWSFVKETLKEITGEHS